MTDVIGYGLSEWGSSPWGGIVLDMPPIIPTPSPGCGELLNWPLIAGFEGRPWPESIDPFALALDYGDDAMLYICALMSVFTDARAADDADLPLPDGDRRGWWADAYGIQTMFADDQRPRGSLLWLLSRSKNEASNPARVEGYIRNSLEWMIAAKLATEISVNAARSSTGTIAVSIVITQKTGGGIKLAHPDFWEVYNRGNHY